MKSPPIVPQEYLSGVTVVDLGDVRVARGLTRRPASTCKHNSILYDKNERRIWCSDCEQDIDPFDGFLHVIEPYDRAFKALERRSAEIAEAEQFVVRQRATKALDKTWRSRKYIPACPHCRMGLFPEDFQDGIGAKMSREYAEAMRRKKQEEKR